MTTNKGYPLPVVLEPPDDACFVIYVPNSPEYIRAFWGGYFHYGSWNAWERTGNTDGSIAGQRWKTSIQRTMAAEKVVDCEFLQELLEDGDMSVNVTNNVTCGECGGGCGGGGCTNIPYGPQPEVHDIPPGLPDEVGNLPTQIDPGGDTPPPRLSESRNLRSL